MSVWLTPLPLTFWAQPPPSKGASLLREGGGDLVPKVGGHALSGYEAALDGRGESSVFTSLSCPASAILGRRLLGQAS
jgi:hypothetical protein